MSRKKKSAMTRLQYIKALSDLGFEPTNAGPLLGISKRQSFRYAAGHKIPPSLALLIGMYLKHGTK